MKKKYKLFLLSLPVALTAAIILPATLGSIYATNNNGNIANLANNDFVTDNQTSVIDNHQYVELYNSTNYIINSTYWKSTNRFDAAVFNSFWVDGSIPYQVKISQIEAFAKSNTPNLVENPPPNPTYTVDPRTLIVNNKTGEIQFDLSLNSYMFNGAVINVAFPIKQKITLYNFTTVSKSSLEAAISTSINNFYPSTFSDQLKQLENNQSSLFAFMNNYFNIGSFPPTTKISFRNFANNATGQLNVNMNVDQYYSNDSYFTYIENPYSYSVNLNFQYQGLTSFIGNTIDISQIADLNGFTIDGFLNELVQPGNNSTNVVKRTIANDIYGLLKNQNKAIKTNDLNLIAFDTNKNNYNIQSNLGILTLSTTLKNLIVTEQEVLTEKQYNKNTSERIYIVGFNAIVDTIVQEDPNAPIVTLSQLTANLNKSGGYYDANNASVRTFIQVITPQSSAPNLRFQFLSCTQPDPNVNVAKAIFSFSNGYVNGQLTTFTQEFFFNILPSIFSTKMTDVLNISYDESLFLPSEVWFRFSDPATGTVLFDTYRKLLLDNAFSNLAPNTAISNIKFSLINYDNFTGKITINVLLNKYLDNSNLIDSTTFKSFGQIVIQGYNSTFATTATINPNYPKNIKPNKLDEYIKAELTTGKSLTQVMGQFFKFTNTPVPPSPSFVVKSYNISNINNDLGTATITINCDNVFKYDAYGRLIQVVNAPFSSNFLLFETIDPTSIKTPIQLTGFNNMLTSEFVNGFNDAPFTDLRKEALINTILNQAYIINQPKDVAIAKIEILNPEAVSDIDKEFYIKVTISSYYDEEGTLHNVPITFPNQTFPKPILVNGDFRDVRDTKFIENSYLVENKKDDLASSFFESDIINFIVTNWKTAGMIGGDIPPNIFDIANDLSIEPGSISYDDPKGTLTVNVSLKTYYKGNSLHVNTTPYEPFTTITLTGFRANVPTIFPTSVVATINQGLPSSIWDKTTPTIAKSWPVYILENVLSGSVNKIIITNPNDIVQSVNDKVGEISFKYEINGYYDSDPNDASAPAIWIETPQTKELVVTGLQIQAPTSFIGQAPTVITPVNASAFTADVWKENNFFDFPVQQKFLKDQNLLNASVSGFNYLFDNNSIVVNNLTGKITLTAFVSSYYDKDNAILSSFDWATKKAAYVKDINHNLPVNQSPSIPQVLKQEIEISGFKTVLATAYDVTLDQNIQYTGAGNLTNQNPVDIVNALLNQTSPNNTLYTGYIKDFLWANIVIGSKLGPNGTMDELFDSLTFVATNPRNRDGTIDITISMTHYWSTSGQWISNNGPLLQSPKFKLSGFLVMNPTDFSNKTDLLATGFITTKTASEIRDALINNTDKTTIDSIKNLLFAQDIIGTKEPYLSASNINNFTIVDVNDTKGQITLKYSLDKYIDANGLLTNAPPPLERTANLILSGFKVISETKMLPSINLNEWLKDENGLNFNVSSQSASEYLNDGDFATKITPLFTINQGLYFDVPLGWFASDNFIEIVNSALSTDKFSINVTVKLRGVYVQNGGTITIGENNFTINLYGFKQPVTGPTTFQSGFSRELADIPEIAFRSYIYSSPINGLRQKFIEQINAPNVTAIANLRLFIFNQWVNLSSNIGDGINRIDRDAIAYEILPQSIGDSLKIEIWLTKYYDNNSNHVDNTRKTVEEQKTLAQANRLLRKVEIRGFREPTSDKGPTIVSKQNRFDISTFINPDDNLPDGSLLNLLPSQAISSQNDKALRLWILEKIYSGNKEGFEFDYENIDITSSFFDDRNGELRITTQLKKYWQGNSPSTIANNGLSHTFTIVFQKQSPPTIINTQNNLTFNVPTNDPSFAQIVNDIKSKTPQNFYAEYYQQPDGGNNWKNFENYVKEWLVKNKNIAFSNLPIVKINGDPFDDNALRDAISITYIRSSDIDASMYLNVKLSTYIDNNGAIIENGNNRSSVQFAGFNKNNQPTYPLDARVDISQNPTVTNGIEHAYIPELAILDASRSTFDKSMPFAKFLALITPIIQKYCIAGRTDGLLESNNINLTSYEQVQFISTFGSLIIHFNFNQIYNSEGQPISGANHPITLTLFGFIKKVPSLQSTDNLIPFVLGGIGVAVLIIFIIIAFIIYYKKRKDVEYQQ